MAAPLPSGSWFIPTNVGNTIVSPFTQGLLTVHPHERGEYHRVSFHARSVDGSSPRTWGIRTCCQRSGLGTAVHPHERGEYSAIGGVRIRSLWFIPTNVGNTRHVHGDDERPAVHPHERGEYAQTVHKSQGSTGSSPRTWGIRNTGRRNGPRTRFIPTNVGNTVYPKSAVKLRPVHPHERGEYDPLSIVKIGPVGSSPRTWGIQENAGGS